MNGDEERIALFLDYENLAIGARENHGGMSFDFKPVADALAERGRVIVRRAYADWLKFGEDGRMLTRHHVELIEIPQRMGSVRKNAADIKMAVDAVELCFARDYITTYVLGTGDSDFTPLVHKLRELNRRVIGIGLESSTSQLLPPACDEFLFYEQLEGVEIPERRAGSRPSRSSGGRGGRGRRGPSRDAVALDDVARVPAVAAAEAVVDADVDVDIDDAELAAADEAADAEAAPTRITSLDDVDRLITQTLAGLERSSGGTVRASSLKRAVLRKVSTFNEADVGFRGFTELLRNLAERGIVELSDGSGLGDPEVVFPSETGAEEPHFELLRTVVGSLATPERGAPLSGLKTQLRRHQPDFSEKRFGYGGFLQFAKAAVARGVVDMAWDDDADDYLLRLTGGESAVGSEPEAVAESAAEETGPTSTVSILPTAEQRRSRRSGRGRSRAAAPVETEESDIAPVEDPAYVAGADESGATDMVEPAAGSDEPAAAAPEAAAEAPADDEVVPEPATAEVAEVVPEPAVAEPAVAEAAVAEAADAAEAAPAPPKRKRATTPRRKATAVVEEPGEAASPPPVETPAAPADTAAGEGAEAAEPAPAPKRRAPRRTKAAAAVEIPPVE